MGSTIVKGRPSRPFPLAATYWIVPNMAVNCPNCGKEARFYPATVKPLSRAEADRERTAGIIEVLETIKHNPNWNGSAAFFGAFYHMMGGAAPQGWEPLDRNATNIGTLRCLSCNLCRRHELDWPASARYQLDFDGQRLWLYNREHASRLIALLEAKNPRDLDWFYWFNNKLPEHFKTEKARKTLPARLRKLLL